MELGHRVQEEGVDKQAWFVYGPDLNGEYGGMQGIGGLEVIVDGSSGEVVAAVNDAFGNLVGHIVDALKPERRFVAHHSPIDVFGRFKNMESEKESRSFAEKLAIELTWRTRRVDETGFYNLGARYYSPQLLEFISPDPAGFASGPNLYAYANNDPVNYVDSDGRFATAAWNTVRETVAGAWNHPDVSAVRNHPTFQGGAQAGFGAMEFGAGATATTFGTATGFTGIGIGVAAAGVGMMSHGADNIVAGARTVYQGYHNPTVTNQFFQSMGMSPGAASTVEMGMSFGMGVGAGAGMGMASRAAGATAVRNFSQATQWTPLNGPGPLGVGIGSTFRGATYTEHVLRESTVLHRVYGESGKMLGPYWSRNTRTGPLRSVIDLALHSSFKNHATNTVKISVPKGTTIFEGIAAPQGGLTGGGNQIFLKHVDPNWRIP